jgi:hypothetical protein
MSSRDRLSEARPVSTASTTAAGPLIPGRSGSSAARCLPSSTAAVSGMGDTDRFQGAVRIAIPAISPVSSPTLSQRSEAYRRPAFTLSAMDPMTFVNTGSAVRKARVAARKDAASGYLMTTISSR